ncbi:AbrB/MazE/SpoVT family DNA-binding domain-containing protein [uncultured Sphingomonas sp.]|uniref:AbrB/MazE/SpoVT family DNA-binding domain-containing protein n=1 Tax=uncultured Sphingomonas sp. TaxID=158754 RepID=UPI003749F37F
MKVAKWGNSLAIRIPADVAKALNLAEGDSVELTPRADGDTEIGLCERRERALAAILSLRGRLPADYRFDRDEANAR